MNVGQLRAIIANVPDDYKVKLVVGEDEIEGVELDQTDTNDTAKCVWLVA